MLSVLVWLGYDPGRGGFQFVEGPVWVPAEGGYLIFSDINRDTVEVLARNGCEVITPPGMRPRIIMMYFLPDLRRSRSSC